MAMVVASNGSLRWLSRNIVNHGAHRSIIIERADPDGSLRSSIETASVLKDPLARSFIAALALGPILWIA